MTKDNAYVDQKFAKRIFWAEEILGQVTTKKGYCTVGIVSEL